MRYVVPFETILQVLELGVQLSVLLGNPVANLEELLTWTEAELLRVTSGDTDMQHTRAQVCPQSLPTDLLWASN